MLFNLTTVLIRCFLIISLCFVQVLRADTEEYKLLIKTAQKQYQQKEYVHVKQTLKPLSEATAPHLEVLFLLGMVAQDEKQYAQAAEYFRQMLSRNPELVRPRLELAKALRMAGENQAAKYHYEQVMSMRLPLTVIYNIQQELFQIRETSPSYRLSFDLVSDTNPNQNTKARTIFIGGVPFTLSEPNKDNLIHGWRAGADVNLPLPSNPTWYASGFATITNYPGTNLDSGYLQASVGKRFDFGLNNVAVESGYHVSSFQEKSLNDGYLFRTRGFYRINPKLGFIGDAYYKTYKYDRFTYLDGEQYGLRTFLNFVPTAKNRLELGLLINAYDAKEEPYSYTQPEIFARYSQEIRGGWIAGLRLETNKTVYKDNDPFFAIKREDSQTTTTIEILNRRLNFFTFTPQVSIGYLKHKSNIELYAFDRVIGRLGFVKEF